MSNNHILPAVQIQSPPEPDVDLKMDIDDTASPTILHSTQRIRGAIVNDLVVGGIPNDSKDTKLLLETLRDMDHTAHQNMKIDLEAKGIENDRAAQEIVNRLARLQPQGPRLMEHEVHGDRLPDIPDDAIPDIDPVPGETDIGSSTENTKEFLERHDNQ